VVVPLVVAALVAALLVAVAPVALVAARLVAVALVAPQVLQLARRVQLVRPVQVVPQARPVQLAPQAQLALATRADSLRAEEARARSSGRARWLQRRRARSIDCPGLGLSFDCCDRINAISSAVRSLKARLVAL
jgi:hypothetical protein